jgi:hypothetical protein
VNDRQANPRVGDPQECPDEPRALLRIISSWKTHPERGRRTKFAMGFLTRILFQLRDTPLWRTVCWPPNRERKIS